MANFYTSDPHFYHAKVIEYCKRPFKDVDHMNEMLVQYWNEVVGPDDHVYVLGDFSLARRAVEVFLPRLNGTKHLIAGNHDHCHPIHARQREERLQRMRKEYYDAGFATIQLELNAKIGDVPVLMHHMPYVGDHTEGERYAKWRPVDNGGWLLHGHVHDLWKQRGKMINVGVDVWDYRPVPEAALADLIAKGPV